MIIKQEMLNEELSDDDCVKGFWDYILKNIDENEKHNIDTNSYNFQSQRPILIIIKML